MSDHEMRLRMAMAAYEIPDYMRDGLFEYIVNHKPAGSFLMAVLENNLRLSVKRADDENRTLLPNYVSFLYDFAPANAWGSEENVSRWLIRPV